MALGAASAGFGVSLTAPTHRSALHGHHPPQTPSRDSCQQGIWEVQIGGLSSRYPHPTSYPGSLIAARYANAGDTSSCSRLPMLAFRAMSRQGPSVSATSEKTVRATRSDIPK